MSENEMPQNPDELREFINDSVEIDADALDLDIDVPEPDVDPWGDADINPDSILTEDDVEEIRADLDIGMSEEDLVETVQSYSLGALDHLLNDDCEHEEHQEMRQALGVDPDGDQEDGGDGDGDGSRAGEGDGGGEEEEQEQEENGGEEEEEEAAELDPSRSGGYSEESESPWGG